MPRPRKDPTTELGRAVVARRGGRSLQDIGGEMGVSYMTLSSIERGAHRPSVDTAVKLARWLGWTVERVIEAATEPA